jgi:hypothetical protein
MSERLDILEHVKNEIAESLSGKKGSADDLRHEIEQLDHNFDFDSYAPYTHQEDDVILDLERDYWRDAEDFLSDKTYKATEWEDARRAYAAALAYTAYSSLWEQTKQELIEEIEQFETDAQDFGCDDPIITLSMSLLHGWAAHNREDSDGTMYFESRQLDGCNGLAKKTSSGVWLSVCFAPKADAESEASR